MSTPLKKHITHEKGTTMDRNSTSGGAQPRYTQRRPGSLAPARQVTTERIGAPAGSQTDPCVPPYRALDMLQRQYAPVIDRKPPFWRPIPAPVAGDVHEPRWTWHRTLDTPTSGVLTLDANAAFVGAISTVEVAHGALRATGRRSFDPSVPGYWLTDVHGWNLGSKIVSPLGSRRFGLQDRVWLTTPTMQLLQWLTDEGIWPAVDVHDSWTGTPRCRLRTWGARIRDDRSAAMMSGSLARLEAIKLGYSQAVTVMQTPERSRIYRPDWASHIRAQHSATMWRRAFAVHMAGHPVLGMAHIDELTVSAETLTAMCRGAGNGGKPVLRLDQDGTSLGSFKIKSRTTGKGWNAAVSGAVRDA